MELGRVGTEGRPRGASPGTWCFPAEVRVPHPSTHSPLAPRALRSRDALSSKLPAPRGHLAGLLPARDPAPGGERACESDVTQAGMRYAPTTSCFTPPGSTCSSSPRSGPAYIPASDAVPAGTCVAWGQHRNNLHPHSGSHSQEAQCWAPPSITDP